MAKENFRIYNVQTIGKCICETFPPLLHDLIIRSHLKHSPHKFAQKSLFPHEKLFQEKKDPPLLFGGRRHCFIFVCFSFIGTNYGLSK